jgi:hypothetical protein
MRNCAGLAGVCSGPRSCVREVQGSIRNERVGDMILGTDSGRPVNALPASQSSHMATARWRGHHFDFPGDSEFANPCLASTCLFRQRENAIFRHADLGTRLGRFGPCSSSHSYPDMANGRYNSAKGLAFLASNFLRKLVSRFRRSITFSVLSFRVACSHSEPSLDTRNRLATFAIF